jgi:energy-coupling factor transporter ATP-binding protein EcfA2
MAILDSVEITNFRALRHLQLPQLGKVNLIVGKNNVGKSSILEALWLYANRGTPSIIWELVEARSESRRPSRRLPKVEDEDERILGLKHLFHGREDIRHKHEAIRIGSLNYPEDQLSIDVQWLDSEAPNSYQQTLFPQPTAPFLVVQVGGFRPIFYRLDRDYASSRPTVTQTELREIHAVLVTSNGLSPEQMANLWDNVALTSSEEDVVAALRIIAPEVERVNLIASHERTWERMPIVKIKGLEAPIPLRSMGDGMLRLFGIALALVNARKGLLLVDEVENGLHYSVQEDVWRLIFALSHKLNLQVFATSHSWDCIEAFQKAANEDSEAEGLLIRLEESHGDNIRITAFDERKLAIATREQIEVR